MKDYLNFILVGIKNLIERVREDLTPLIRNRIITIITIDVHERDVVDMFVNKKISDSQHFSWQSQLKFYLELRNPKDEHKVCVAEFAIGLLSITTSTLVTAVVLLLLL